MGKEAVIAGVLIALVAQASAKETQRQWCPNFATMAVLISGGYQLKAVYKTFPPAPDSAADIMTQPDEARSETVYFLQYEKSLVKCSEKIGRDNSSSIACEHLVNAFDVTKVDGCK